MAKETSSSSTEPENNDELEQITIARALLNFRLKEKMTMSNPNAPIPFPKKFQFQNPRPTSPQPLPAATSKILPLFSQKTAPRSRHLVTAAASSGNSATQRYYSTPESRGPCRPNFPAVGAAPYVPIRQMRSPCQGIAPPVTIRTAVPVFSPPPATVSHHQVMQASSIRVAPPVNIRQAVPVYAAPPARIDEPAPICKDKTDVKAESMKIEEPPTVNAPSQEDKTDTKMQNIPPESETMQSLLQLRI